MPDNKIYICKILKNVPFKLHVLSYRKFKDQRTNDVNLEEVAHYELFNMDFILFVNSAIFSFGLESANLKEKKNV